MRFFLLFTALLLLAAPLALAEDGIVECGVPKDVTVSPGETQEYCDIYSRQMAYAEKRRKLRDELDARRENFAAPGVQARENYIKSLNEYYGYDTPETEDDGVMVENGESRVYE